MITQIEDYFAKGCGRCNRFATPDCSTHVWAEGLAGLRQICKQTGLVAVVKWGHPCYMHAGRNIAIIGAFRGDFRLSFFNAGLMQDPERLLEKQGPNAQVPNMIRFVENGQVAGLAPVITLYLAEAMGYAEAGMIAPRVPSDIDLPEEMVEAMESDAHLAEAFRRLTPGRQKSYVIQLTSTKTPAVRVARIAKFRGKILAGKGATER